eukprot:TRINITY_DN66198_c8_g2_i1.p1 TRINITY_DN66198_c8_g2~~TRINITY_DN66198_c8_g2_i1.p1  ORF type:complete len:1053 (+),score=546.99 TRINITY_DN66198_c8_g2_i1:78-3236(+)
MMSEPSLSRSVETRQEDGLREDGTYETLRFAEIATKRPIVVSIVITVVCMALSAVALSALKINTSPERGRGPYGVNDEIRTIRVDAFKFAKREFVDPSLVQDQQTVKNERSFIMLLYKARDGVNVLTKSNVEAMHAVEQSIMNNPDYTKYCWRCPSINPDSVPGCAGSTQQAPKCRPPLSFVNYAYATRANATSPWVNDGRNANMERDWTELLNTASSPLVLNASNPFGTKFFFSKEFSATNQRAEYVRTMIWLGLPLAGYKTDQIDTNAQVDLADDWTVAIKDSVLDDAVSKYDGQFTLLYGGGDKLIAKMIDEVLFQDGLLATLSALFVWIYISFHCHSLFLGSVGVMHILFSFPMAFFVTRFIFQILYVDTISMFLIFIILGIGADDIFVFYDAWRQSEGQPKAISGTEVGRMSYTLRRAASAMLTTSSTTAGAFVASAVTSNLMPVVGLAWLATLMVAINYTLVITLFPSNVLIYERYIKNKVCPCCCNPVRRRERDLQRLEAKQQSAQQLTNKPGLKATSSQVDVELVATNGNHTNNGSDKQNGHTSNGRVSNGDANDGDADAPAQPITPENPLGVDVRQYGPIERFLYQRFGPMILRYKYYIVSLAVVVVIIFGSLGAQLQGATAPPEFLPSDHPLQIYTDAMVNNFPSSSDDNLMIGALVWGLKGVSRDGHSMFDYGTDACHKGPCGSAVFDETFRPELTGAQEIMARACREAVQSKCVRGNVYTSCFMDELRIWRESNGSTFPIPQNEFYTQVNAFLAIPANRNKFVVTKRVWLENGNKLRYVSADYQLLYFQNRFYSGAEVTPCYDELKDVEIRLNNEKVAGADNVWMTSDPDSALWSRTYTGQQFVKGAVRGMMAAMLIAGVVLLIATHNYIAAGLAFFWVVGVVACVLGCAWLAGYEVGIIEAISASLVVGLSVDFSVHQVHHYVSSLQRLREHRLLDTFLEMGISILAGAITSFGASIWLLLCALLFFSAFGFFVLLTILFSLCSAFFALSATLAIIGPEHDDGDIPTLVRAWLAKRKQQQAEQAEQTEQQQHHQDKNSV